MIRLYKNDAQAPRANAIRLSKTVDRKLSKSVFSLRKSLFLWVFLSVLFFSNTVLTFGQSCDALFYATADTAAKTINFTNASNNATSYSWTFGDGATSTVPSPQHTYTATGKYYVCLTAISTIPSCTNSYCDTVYVNSNINCAASFASFQDNVGSGVSFLDESTGDAASWKWSFGDGTTSVQQSPHHLYTAPGIYTVCLKIFNANQTCTDMFCHQVNVDVTNPCGQSSFTYLAEGGNKMSFVNTSTGNQSDWFWTFGDNKFSKLQDPTYTYNTAGNYYVCLNSTDALNNCASQYCEYVNVNVPNPCGTAYFTHHENSPTNIYFADGSTGTTTNWYWDFGNGTTSTDNNPSSNYSLSGTYHVCLTTVDSVSGCIDTYCEDVYINVPDPCGNAYFVHNALDITGHQFDFADQSTGNPTNWFWDFGNGISSYEQNPTYTFNANGVYTVCLSVHDSVGNCVDTYCEDVHVGPQQPLCKAYFEAHADSTGNTFYFANGSEGNANQWFWDFGNGMSSTDQDPSYTYSISGIYTVCLTIFDSAGTCADTYCAEIYVEVPDPCGLTYFGHQNVTANEVSFFDGTTGNTTGWFWDFGNGFHSTLQNPTYTYSISGSYYVCLTTVDSVSGCIGTFCDEIAVNIPDPCGNGSTFFSHHEISATHIYFADGSSHSPTNWYWDFGNGDASTEQNPSSNYTVSGTYHVCLTTIDSVSGCSDTYCEEVYINVPDPCGNAYFSEHAMDNTGNQFYFADGSTGNPTSWFWDFGNGIFSDEQNPTYTFNTNGVHTVCLTVYDSVSNCFDTYCADIQQPVCVAYFEAHADSTGNTFYFSDLSDGHPTQWFWDFGNGNSSTEQHPSYTFANSGTYAVCVTIFNSVGTCSDTYCEDIYVEVPDPCDQTYFDYHNVTGNEVSFFDGTPGNTTGWFWDFGNGFHSTLQNPTYTYSTSGSYYVCLTTVDSVSGCMRTFCNEIAVNIPEPCGAAYFSHHEISATNIYFADASSHTPTNWYWDFGNGDASTEQNPSSNYTVAGSYHVCLTTVDSVNGCVDTYCEEVYINIPDTCGNAYFSHYAVDTTGHQFYFADGSTGNPAHWYYSFGDGILSSEQNPTYTFSANGVYNVCLTVYDSVGHCSDTYCEDIYVGPTAPDCHALYEYTNTTGNNVSFTDMSNGNNLNWFWDFGDGNTSTTQNSSHQYAVAGVYQVCLTVFDDSVCSNTYCTDVYVGSAPPCPADFSYALDSTGMGVMFTDASSSGVISWTWYFGDGIMSYEQNPFYVYSDTGSYEVCLTTFDSTLSCSDTYCQIITITDNTGVNELIGNVTGFESYPNPFSENTTIKYSINANKKVDLVVYDVLGNKVAVLVNEIQPRGDYSIEFNSGSLSSGLYVVQMVVDGKVTAKRLVINK